MSKDKIRYAFVSNIIEDKDVRLSVFYPILGWIIPLFVWRILFIIKALLGRGYICVAEYDTFGKAIGYTILIEMTARQYVSKRWLKLGKKVTLKACLYAQNELKVDIIGLGSLTKSITSGGRYLKQNGITVAVTHGDSYSVASGLNGIEQMIMQLKMGNSGKPIISVIGAYGKIGRAIVLLLSAQGYKVIAMARNMGKLKKLKQETDNKVVITDSLQYAFDHSQLSIMVTSAPFSIITEEMLDKSRTYYFYDMGQPYNLFPADYWKLIKKGYNIVRVDGGFEGGDRDFDINFWMRLNKGVMYACFVETVMQALERDFEDHIGQVDVRYVNITRQRAKKWGFYHQTLSCYNNPLKEVITNVVKIQKENIISNSKFEKVAAIL